MDLSSLPEMKNLESGLKATDLTQAVCERTTLDGYWSNFEFDQIRTVLSKEEVAMKPPD